MRGGLRAVAVAVLTAGLLLGCTERGRTPRASTVDFGDAEAGKVAMRHYGCVGCHVIPGVRDAVGLVGPPLTKMGRRSYIAGELANTPENLVRWIMDPQGVEPGTAMPDLGVSRDDARNIAAYLERLD
jgi:cytochrome c2